MRLFTLLLLALAFSSSEMRTAGAAVACPQIVDTVCAVGMSKQLKTYNNKCEAMRAGGRFLHQGVCFPEFCAHICIEHGVYGRGVFTGRLRLYDNLCWAEKNFARYIRDGKCP